MDHQVILEKITKTQMAEDEVLEPSVPESKSGALPTWLYPCILKLKWGG